MNFKREQIQLVFEEAVPLLQMHWEEIAHYQDIKLEPDFGRYTQLEESGAVRCFTARDDANKLIGYSVFFVRENIHYKSSVQAVQDILFIHPGRRGTGMRFVKWCDEQLKNDGVQAVYHHVKAAHNFGPMLERLGYQLVDLIYARRLDKWE